MARAVKKVVPARKAKPAAALPQIAAAVSPEFQAAAKAYANKRGITISSLVVAAVSGLIGGKVRDSVSRRTRKVA